MEQGRTSAKCSWCRRGTQSLDSTEDEELTAFISTSSDFWLLPFRARMALRSLSSLSLVMTTFEAATPMGTVAPLPLSRETPSTKMRKFLRWQVVTRPSRPL